MDNLGPPTHPPGSYLTPLLYSLAGVVCASLALVAYHLLFVKYCIVRRPRTAMAANSISTPVEGGEMVIGVEEHVLNTIPILLYSENNTQLAKIDQSECVICLGELEEGDKVRSLPNCGHVFHVPCIDDWFLAHTNCPICRAPIVAPIDIASVLQESINVRRERTPNLAQFLEQGDEDDGGGGGGSNGDDNDNASNSGQSSTVLLRHSLSLALPMEGKPQRFIELKRSLSMDQRFVIIDIQGESEEKATSPSCSSYLKSLVMENRSGRSIRQLDLVSSRWLRSFSQMRLSQSALSTETLPC
ncbi:hypothetical protein GH714_038844 [Hevea brasiliensis]|uniref:RING-type E3 ubiquitin transferase n=1 Tax=Hevea brasiliensis TaxID=3981 RepID=A0A6A6KPG6_HEVBR|nr:hypothetical protein GH714_038844 [Hevea brasiliensis]